MISYPDDHSSGEIPNKFGMTIKQNSPKLLNFGPVNISHQ